MSTEIKQINGFVRRDKEMEAARVLVTASAGHAGEIVTFEASGIAIGVPIKDLEKIISRARSR